MRKRGIFLSACFVVACFLPAGAADDLMGEAAFGDWKKDAPGVRRLIRPEHLPAPFATASVGNGARLVTRPADAWPKVPEGFEVSLFAEGLGGPRVIRVAPNGDIFVAESGMNRVLVFRAADGAPTPAGKSVFAEGFDYPYGIAFYPRSDPQWVYVAQTESVVRFPYKAGDLQASGPRETVIAGIPAGGHSTRDIVFSEDGKTLYLSVGSGSNVAEGQARRSQSEIAEYESAAGLGVGWGSEFARAAVLAFDPDGKNGRVVANGIRNCSGLAIDPASARLYCATNERDGLGDNLPPDYVTSVEQGGFYGWPWYYIGGNEDPRHKGVRPELKDKVKVPDFLIQAHSAPLGVVFYDSDAPGAFPPEYRGEGFVTLHGSWNRALRTGYKVVRILMYDGAPTGKYEDFLTGFVLSDEEVWGRPVGIAVAKDGALLVSEDGNDTIWRVAAKR